MNYTFTWVFLFENIVLLCSFFRVVSETYEFGQIIDFLFHFVPPKNCYNQCLRRWKTWTNWIFPTSVLMRVLENKKGDLWFVGA